MVQKSIQIELSFKSISQPQRWVYQQMDVCMLTYLTKENADHEGIWRSVHCRLCINCYGTAKWGGGGGVGPRPLQHTT